MVRTAVEAHKACMNLTAQQTVIVIGGSSGIGLGVARAVAARGAHLVIVGRSREKLERAALELEGARTLRTITADVTREEQVEQLFESVPELDHLVVTAADLRYATVDSLSLDMARTVIDSKILAALLLAKHGGRRIRPGGSIVFTTGVAAERPAARGALTATVNGALEALVRALALELAPTRVNALSPGWVDTPLWDEIAPTVAGMRKEAVFAQFASRLPVRRIGRPDDLGHAAVFLMENEFSTGATLHVDGGHRLV
jgi:NAD(P)-dependent dehydrogenase (short-subunit alcohol dehydrogenase family)